MEIGQHKRGGDQNLETSEKGEIQKYLVRWFMKLETKLLCLTLVLFPNFLTGEPKFLLRIETDYSWVVVLMSYMPMNLRAS